MPGATQRDIVKESVCTRQTPTSTNLRISESQDDSVEGSCSSINTSRYVHVVNTKSQPLLECLHERVRTYTCICMLVNILLLLVPGTTFFASVKEIALTATCTEDGQHVHIGKHYITSFAGMFT